jgi:hypothetical protein
VKHPRGGRVVAGLAVLVCCVVLVFAGAGATTKGHHSYRESAPSCSAGTKEQCYINVWLHQGGVTTGAYCDSFEASSGSCLGYSEGTNPWEGAGYFPKYGIQTTFSWTASGARRAVDYTVDASFTIVQARIVGNVPSPGSSTLNVSDAWVRESDVHYKTVSTGGDPGLPGGSLYIDYGHKVVDSYVHMYGYLVPK